MRWTGLWQMDASRMQMQGRWAEWVGAAGIEADTLARRLRVSAACIRDYAALGTAARTMVDAYTAGVNAWLGTHPAPLSTRFSARPPSPGRAGTASRQCASAAT